MKVAIKWSGVKQREYFKQMENEFNIKTPQDWYNISIREFLLKKKARSLLKEYNGKLLNALQSNYPHIEWNANNFRKYPRNYWDSLQNQRKFLTEISQSLNVNKLEDWANISQSKIIQYGGRGLISKYKSINEAYSTIFPEVNWKANKVMNNPRYYWNSIINQRNFLISLSTELKFKTTEEWYSITAKDIINNGGKMMLKKYSSIYSMLKILLPEIVWNICKFKHKSHLFWSSQSNHLLFLQDFAKLLNLNSIYDLIDIKTQTVIKNGGLSLIRYYGSYFKALTILFPDIKWNIFQSRSSKKWSHFNTKNFLSILQLKFQIKEKNDWFRISQSQLKDIEGGHLVVHRGGLYSLLSSIYSDEVWELKNFETRSKKARQFSLFKKLLNLFPMHLIIEEYHHILLSFDNEIVFSFDFFIPSFNLAVEYNGEHHYEDLPSGFSPVESYQARDNEKAYKSLNSGVNLITIPFWCNDLSLSDFHIEKFVNKCK